MTLSFFAEGKPEPQGSSKGFVVRDRRTGRLRAAITSDNTRLRPWRCTVQDAARRALDRAGLSGHLLVGPVRVSACFVMPAPKTAQAKLAKGRAVPCVTRPDTDKLARALLDALTGMVFGDDSQVVALGAVKRYQQPRETPGVRVLVSAGEQPPTLQTDAQTARAGRSDARELLAVLEHAGTSTEEPQS